MTPGILGAMPVRASVSSLPLLLAAGLLASCGGSYGGAGRARTQTVAARPAAPAPPPAPAPAPAPEPSNPRDPLELPAKVPLKATHAADPAQASVIRAWSKALRAGDIAGASALWAVPSKVQNATPVLTLATRGDVRTFNLALPCGSVVTSVGGGSGGFTIAKVRLTQRKGARCDASPGATARTAILVRDGKIVEWYRLPDNPDGGPPSAQPAPAEPPDLSDSTTI